MKQKALTTRDDFEFWLSYMDEALENFRKALPVDVREKLDLSSESLNALEKHLLANYLDTETIIDPGNSGIADGAARYIGETFRQAVGGHWNIELNNPKSAFFGIPILTGSDKILAPICPLALVTATVNRRTGNYLHSILENVLK